MDNRPPYPADFELVLASQSPRRHSLLRDLGVPFRVAASNAEEVLEGADAQALAERNALAKIRAAVLPDDVSPDAFILGTDTVVTLEGRTLGKAASAEEAAGMLRLLSGRFHEVVSGVALVRGIAGLNAHAGTDGLQVAAAVTQVTFAPLDEESIAAYVASGEWRGKAGAYAVQGLAGMFVTGICGEYSNVVGLPLCLLARLFRSLGFDLLRRSWV